MELINENNSIENKKGMILPRCGICDEVPVEGICGVSRLNKTLICNICFNKILNIDIGSPEYQIWVEKIKKIYK